MKETTRRPLVAGNWKMNASLDAAKKLAREVASYAADFSHVDLLIAPVSTVLLAVHEEIKDSKLGLAAQNVHYKKSGAYTGEVSLEMIKDCGCSWVILGHSERRQYFGESDELVNRKTIAALAEDVNPIVCVGESLEERKSGWMKEKVTLQVMSAFASLTPEQARKVTVAYEPIWAIGTGETATPEQAQEVHKTIRELLTKLYCEKTAAEIRILYGGSVKPGNIAELIAQPDIDGALVGGASLKASDFKEIAAKCQAHVG